MFSDYYEVSNEYYNAKTFALDEPLKSDDFVDLFTLQKLLVNLW